MSQHKAPELAKPRLSDLTISLAFQLEAYGKKNPESYEKHINLLHHEVIQSITQNYDTPADVLRGTQPHVRRGRSASQGPSRAVSVDNKEDPVTFPLSWTHEASLADAVTSFIKGVRYYTDTEFFLSWKSPVQHPPSPPQHPQREGQLSQTSLSSPLRSVSGGNTPISGYNSPRAPQRISFLPPSHNAITPADVVNRILFPQGRENMSRHTSGQGRGYQGQPSGGVAAGPSDPLNQQRGNDARNAGPQDASFPPNAQNQQGLQGSSRNDPLPGNTLPGQPPPGVDPQLFAAILQAVNHSVTTIIPEAIERTMSAQQAERGRTGPPGERGERGEQGEPGENGRGSTGHFRATELGFFHPDCPDSWGAGDIVPNKNELIFRDVYTFCSQAQDFSVMKGEEVVRENLNSCFREAAANWWLKILSRDERDAMIQLPNGLTRQINRLQDQFKITMSSALEELGRQSYSGQDALERKDPAVYVQNVAKYATQAGIVEEDAQATWAWNHLNVKFQTTVPPPTSDTTIHQFIEQLKNRKELWYRMKTQEAEHQKETRRELKDKEKAYDRERTYNRNRERKRDRDQDRNFPGQYAGNRPGGFTGVLPYYPSAPPPFSYPPYGPRQQYQGYQPQIPYGYTSYPNNIPNNTDKNQPTSNPTSKQPLQITAGPRQPLQITAGNAEPVIPANQSSNYPQRGGYGNRGYGQRSYRPRNQYGNGPSYGNYGREYPPHPPPQQAYPVDMPIPQPAYWGEEAYFNDFSTSAMPGYHDYDQQAPHDYYYGGEEEFQDASESIPGDNKENEEEVDVGFVTVAYHVSEGKIGQRSVYRKCKTGFKSNNLLHAHLKAKACPRKENRDKELSAIKEQPAMEPKAPPELTATKPEVLPALHSKLVISSSTPTMSNGMSFRSWCYLTGRLALSLEGARDTGCLDTGCPITIIDRIFLRDRLSDYQVKTHDSPITLRGIGPNFHSTDEWTTISFYMDGTTNKGNPATIKITRDFHIVDNLKANVLIGMDVLCPEKAIIDLPAGRIHFGSCENVAVPVECTPRDNVRVRRIVRADSAQEIPPRSTAPVAIRVKGNSPLPDRDFFFEPHLEGVYAHFMDSKVDFVNVRNDKEVPLRISRRQRIGTILEYEAGESYPVEVDNHSLAAKSGDSEAPAVAEFTRLLDPKPAITRTIDPSMETKLSNGITIYGNEADVTAIQHVAEQHPRIWEDSGDTIDLPEEEWLTVPVTTDWQSTGAKLGNKVYPLSSDARALIDEKFDKMHTQGKMSWTTGPSPFAFPVFVVWKTVYEGPEKTPRRKGRVVVDIRGLNKITIADNYPLPLQSDIVSSVQGYTHISVVDCSGQFHLFLVKKEDRHKFTVISHRGAEHYNVAAMGFKGSVPYVQRKMDDFLRPHRHFARCYVDDIVIFSNSLRDHLAHLQTIFGLFAHLKVTLEPKKSYLGYPSVTLLGQKVDRLGMTTTEERVSAIKNLHFPNSLNALEIYIGMANWLRSNIRYFAQIIEPLQRRKTELLKHSPSKGGKARQAYSRSATFEPTEDELEAFKMLQEALTSETYLHHRDPARQLYIDLDGSKGYGFGVMIYHVKGDPQGDSYPRADIQPILFLSKLLNAAETRYWPTELEVAALVWTLRKISHLLIQTADKRVIIFTDHSATTDIAKQVTLSSSSTDRLNLRLVRASQYVSQFDLDVRWRPGKQNVVPDALSRLLHKREEKRDTESPGILDEVLAFNMTYTQMSPGYKENLIKAYADDKKWSKIFNILHEEKQRLRKQDADPTADSNEVVVDRGVDVQAGERDVTLPNIQFFLREDLIYYRDNLDGRERLCVPKSMEQEIFDQAHDKRSHGGFSRTYERIVQNYYMRHLTRRLKRYILHCPECQLNQTKRHAPYGSLRPVLSPPRIFHTITIDFILALPALLSGLNALLTVTCKFSKKVTMVSGKDTWDASQWAVALLYELTDWGIPCAIISDRDPKFMSLLWKTIFKTLGTDLMVSTAYHPQTDGQSERTNQTVEIALRYHLACYPEEDWDKFVITLRGTLNNSTNASTGLAPNEIIYGMKLNEGAPHEVMEKEQPEVTETRNVNRRQAADSLAFAAVDAKQRYDTKHVPLSMEEGDLVFLTLHKGYRIPGLDNSKLSNQRCGPFKILKKIGTLAYKLDLPPTMGIHPVISVASLEPAPKGKDPYDRKKNNEQPAVLDNDPEGTGDHYEIELLLDRRERHPKGREPVVEYLVKWKNWSPYWNSWYHIRDLPNAKEAIADYENKYGRRSVREYQTAQRRTGDLTAPAEQSEQPLPPPPQPLRRRPGRPRKNAS